MVDQASSATSSSEPLPPSSTTEKAADPTTRAEYYARFFISATPPIPPPFAQLLEQYSGIPPPAQSAHVLRTRDRAWTHRAFPCLGRFRFLELDLSTHPLYHTDVLPILTSSSSSTADDPIFLDIGCCLGQDLRKLIHDGVPASRVFGADLDWAFIDAGYDLFADEPRLPRSSHFLVPGNVLASADDDNGDDALARLDGACNVINLNAVFHLFDLASQRQVAARTVRLLNRHSPGRKLILGAHLGMEEPTAEHRPDGDKFRHNMRSWTELWDGVLGGGGGDESEEWKGIVKNWEVGGRLEKRMREGRPITTRDDGSSNAAGNNDNDNVQQQQQQAVAEESPYRWQVWWVWIEF